MSLNVELPLTTPLPSKNGTGRKRGRPRKYEPIGEEPIKYYKPKGTKSTGRPKVAELTKLTEKERTQHNRQLERKYMLRRGKFVVKINYYVIRYSDLLPKEFIDLPQNTDDEVLAKFNKMYDFINEMRKNELLKTAIQPTLLSVSSESDTSSENE